MAKYRKIHLDFAYEIITINAYIFYIKKKQWHIKKQLVLPKTLETPILNIDESNSLEGKLQSQAISSSDKKVKNLSQEPIHISAEI